MKKIAKIAGFVLVPLCLFLVCGYALARHQASSVLEARHDTSVATVLPPADVEHGRHLVTAVLACTSCHGEDLGGSVMSDDPAFGRIVAPNLTRGEGGVARTAADWEHAIRFGLHADGTPLLLMPSDQYTPMSAEDLSAAIAFLDTLPPVDRPLPPSALGPIGNVVLATGGLHVAALTIEPRVAESAPAPAPTAEYGSYVARVSACAGCHGETFGGREVAPDEPPAPDISPSGLHGWSRDDLARALRTGTRPDGRALDDFMPWRGYAGLSDVEIDALYAYLSSLPPAA